MALKNVFALKGNSQIHTEFGPVSAGEVELSVDAYIRVTTVSGDKSLLTAAVIMTGKGMRVEKSYTFAPDMNGMNFIAQAYGYLKALPEFADAEDC